MTDRHAPPYRPAAVLRAALCVTPANVNLPYDERLNGTPRGRLPPSRWFPAPVLDPEVGHDRDWRRLRLEVVR